ncbi:MAG: Dam family site-specific DNA-(adenine-N6)-methyltransferase [Lachnospiraceae bacterium]|nr:Dam family site-specific DNA-(adenine-N6)-methyltransferase [Lachnospiraceae bacterium]
MASKRMTPVLKWAGGKTQLIEPIMSKIPKYYNNYFEPFIGGGAILFAVSPQNAYINDTNEQLINLYIQLKNSPDIVTATVDELDKVECNKEQYCCIRERYNEKILTHKLDAECAALMIWINKHCFNGLYRVNGKGLFNVPYNNRIGGKSIDRDNINAISAYLRNSDIKISCLDFEEICENVCADDFVYFDSPYIPISETADFTSYTKDSFTFNDHKRLSKLFKRLDKLGARVMLSNNDVPLIYDFYEGYNIQKLDVKRMINRNAAKRTGKEVLITNY